MSNWWGYVRVSTEKQGISPEVQKHTITAFAQARGQVLAGIFQDAPVRDDEGRWSSAASGTVPIDEREAGGALCRAVRRGDHVVVAKLDRLCRSLSDYVNRSEQWSALGVTLHVCDMPDLDQSSPIGRLVMTMLASFAQFERDITSQRTKEALAERRRNGMACNKYAGYGFKWERRYSRERGKYVKVRVPDVEERAVMKQIAIWRLQGNTVEEIRQFMEYDLKAKNKYGKPWSAPRIYRAWVAELRLQMKEGAQR